MLGVLLVTEAQKPGVWAVLEQCKIFQNVDGRMTSLPPTAPVLMLPHHHWERHLAQLIALLSVTILPFHISNVQQKLLRYSHLQPASPAEFLQNLMLPALSISEDSSVLPLVAQALDDLVGLPDLHIGTCLTHLPIDGRRCPISCLLDGNSSTFQLLFDQSPTGTDWFSSSSSVKVCQAVACCQSKLPFGSAGPICCCCLQLQALKLKCTCHLSYWTSRSSQK